MLVRFTLRETERGPALTVKRADFLFCILRGSCYILSLKFPLGWFSWPIRSFNRVNWEQEVLCVARQYYQAGGHFLLSASFVKTEREEG